MKKCKVRVVVPVVVPPIKALFSGLYIPEEDACKQMLADRVWNYQYLAGFCLTRNSDNYRVNKKCYQITQDTREAGYILAELRTEATEFRLSYSEFVQSYRKLKKLRLSRIPSFAQMTKWMLLLNKGSFSQH